MLSLGAEYQDARGQVWKIIDVNNGQREDIGPVTAGRWEGKRYQTRIFLRSGRYSLDVPQWHLIAPVAGEEEGR